MSSQYTKDAHMDEGSIHEAELRDLARRFRTHYPNARLVAADDAIVIKQSGRLSSDALVILRSIAQLTGVEFRHGRTVIGPEAIQDVGPRPREVVGRAAFAAGDDGTKVRHRPTGPTVRPRRKSKGSTVETSEAVGPDPNEIWRHESPQLAHERRIAEQAGGWSELKSIGLFALILIAFLVLAAFCNAHVYFGGSP